VKDITQIDDPRFVKALAHPLRVRILAILESRSASPSELAKDLGGTVGNVCYHVQILEKYGMVRLVGRTPGRRGSVARRYEALGRHRVSDEAWARVPRVVREAHEGAVVAQMIDYVQKAQAEGGFDRSDAHLTRTPLALDVQGWSELAKELLALLGTAERIERESAKRLQAVDHRGEISAGMVVMLFEAADFGAKPPPRPQRRRASGSATSRRAART
jgi:DNA-binding transcriptional ArsR family regulator